MNLMLKNINDKKSCNYPIPLPLPVPTNIAQNSSVPSSPTYSNSVDNDFLLPIRITPIKPKLVTPSTPSRNQSRILAERSRSSPQTHLHQCLSPDIRINYPKSSCIKLYNNNFECTEKIGDGSQGVVYKAFDKGEERFYAIKILKTRVFSIKRRQRLEQEIEYVKSVSPHPHLLSYISYWEYDSEFFLQMDLCKETISEQIDTFIKNKPGCHFEEQTLWEYIADIALGIHQLHKHNFVHRDIKPENLFICEENNFVRIGDFGLLQKQGLCDDIQGDNRYCSQDTMQFNYTYTFADDIFSFGVSIFEMASLREIQSGGELWELLRANGNEDYISKNISYYSEALNNLVCLMLRPIASERPSVSEILELPNVLEILSKRKQTPDSFVRNISPSSIKVRRRSSSSLTPSNNTTQIQENRILNSKRILFG